PRLPASLFYPPPNDLPGVGLRCGAAGAREDRFDFLDDGAIELEVEDAHGVVELLDRARADDGSRYGRAPEQPSDRDVGRLLANLDAELLVRLEARSVLGDISLGVVARAAPFRRLLERAAQNAALERTVRNQPEPVRLARGDHFELDRAI